MTIQFQMKSLEEFRIYPLKIWALFSFKYIWFSLILLFCLTLFDLSFNTTSFIFEIF